MNLLNKNALLVALLGVCVASPSYSAARHHAAGSFPSVASSNSKQSPQDGNQKGNQRMASGRVVDKNGDPVVGATILQKGTQNGTVTDLNGRYSLEAPAGSVLEVSYIGFVSQQVKAGSNVQVVLSDDTKSIEEIVVVGYGTRKKANLTGSVAAVSGDEISKRPVANSAVLLQGVIPGLRVNQSLGQPGNESVSLRVRGQGTFSSAGSDPLVLINGVPGSLTNLDPSVIESVSVLKDAASAAIYGARAANGVILVTTKDGSGVPDKVVFSYNGNVGFHTPTRMYDLVTDSPTYMELANKAWANSGSGLAYTQDQIDAYRTKRGVDYPSFDWLDYMFNTATVWTHNLTVAGSGQKVNYNLSLNYVDQPGTMRGFNYKKYNLTANLSAKINEFVKVGFYTEMMYGDRLEPRQRQADAFLSSMSQPPTYMPWLPDDGSGVRKYATFAYSFESGNKNMPAIIANGVNRKNKAFDLNANLWVSINLMKNLEWYTKGAARLEDSKEKVFVSGVFPLYTYRTGVQKGTLDTGALGLDVADGRRFYKNLYSYLKYHQAFMDGAHKVELMAGYNREDEKYETLGAYRKEYAFPLPVINAGSTANWTNRGGEENWALQSYFGRFNYNYRDRYLFEANARYDGTSRIASENRWGFFPSFSGAWRATQEPFIQKLDLKWLSDFKIRASWGELGNQNIGLYPYQAVISGVSDYPFSKTADGVVLGFAQTAYANRNIKWESTSITDIGFDLVLFNELSVTFDWYNKLTRDILRESQVSALLGLSAPIVNKGKVRNSGIELSVAYNHLVKTGTFRGLHYNLGGNIVHNTNKLVTFGAEEISGYHLYREGIPYGTYYMLDCIGVFADQNEINNSPKQFNDTTLPGDLKYRDVNGDKKIDDNDRVQMGGQFPSVEYAFTGSATWKGFDVSFITQGVGNKKYYTTNWGVKPFFQGSAPTKEYVKHMWTPENPNGAKYPRLYFGDMGGSKNTRPNSFFLKDASFFRVKNLTFGYTLPSVIAHKLRCDKIRVYFSGDNLLTITPYKGCDPERSGDGNDAQYPQNRVYSFGVNINL